MYDKRFYMQAIVDYFASCKPELGITDVHWSDDDADGIAVITENDLFILHIECYPGLGGESTQEIFKEG